MRFRKWVKIVVTGCILMSFTGCGADAAAGNPGCISIAEAKEVVLENAGLAEDKVRFVRMQLESENGASRYDMEFISENMEYDYMVDAVTGEILSMNCETGQYDIENVPEEIAQSAGTQSAGTQPTESQAVGTQPGGTASTDTQPVGAQSTESQSTGTPSVGTQPGAGQQYIGSEAAKQAALTHCGLDEKDVRFAHAHLEYDDGKWKYDVEFHKDNVEYDYDIDALTGEVLSFDHDAEHHHHGTANLPESGLITEDSAKQIALEYGGVAETDAQYLKVELDYDDGRAEYEVEWYVGRTEYSCSVDALTGEVLSFEKEID